MAIGKVLDGVPYTGKSYARIDEGTVASAIPPRRGWLHYRKSLMFSCALLAACSFAETPDYFVEWVKADADLYIDTGIIGRSGTKAEIKFANISSGNVDPCMLGSAEITGSTWKHFSLCGFWNESMRYWYGEINRSTDYGYVPYGGDYTTEHEITSAGVLYGRTTSAGSVPETMRSLDLSANPGTIDTGASMYLFAEHGYNPSSDMHSVAAYHRCFLYYCKIWQIPDGGTDYVLVRDLRPCVKDGIVGVYDAVTQTILYPHGNALESGPAKYDLNWPAASKVGEIAHPATQWGRISYGTNRSGMGKGTWKYLYLNDYTFMGEGDIDNLNGANTLWQTNNLSKSQLRFDGWFYVDPTKAGTWVVNQRFDDYFAFFIDNLNVLYNNTYTSEANATVEVSEGWHRFTIICGDTFGGFGSSMPHDNLGAIPFTVTVGGTAYAFNTENFPQGSGRNTVTLDADADWSANGTILLAGGAVLDLNGHNLVVKDIVCDDYVGAMVTNSVAKKSVIYFTGTPTETKAYKDGIIKGIGEKIIIAQDGDQIATPTVYKPSISINFTNGNGLSTVADIGLAGYEVPGTSWNNFAVANNATYSTVSAVDSTGAASVMSGVSVAVSGTRGSYSCSALASASNLLHGYIDEDANNMTPTVTVTGIPYYKYRVLVYHATDTENVPFGYDTINGTNYTYENDALTEGTTAWGNSGADYSANAIAEGCNVLLTGELSGSTITVVGHRGGGDSWARGCIAAIQIIEVKPEIGENDLEIPVSGDTTYTVSETKTLNGTIYLTGNGTLTLDGSAKISSATIEVSDGVTLNVNADHLDGTTFTGSGTVVYNNSLPVAGKGWTESAWTGTVQIKAVTDLVGSTDFSGSVFLPNDYGNSNSTLELNDCAGWLPYGKVEGDNVCTVPLKITGMFTINNGISNTKFTINKLLGAGCIYTTGNGATTTIQVLNADDFTGYVRLNSKRVIFGETIPTGFTGGQIYVGSGFTFTVPNSDAAWYGTGGITLDGELKATALSNFGGGTTITTTDNGVFTLINSNNTRDEAVDYARITGTGTLRYADVSGKWRSLSANHFPTGMVCENNLSAGLILTTQGENTIGSLAGSGSMRSDWGGTKNVASRTLRILQAKDTEYSGVFHSDDRISTVTVSPGATTAGTLTLSGTQTVTNDLVVEANAKVNLTGTWFGTTTVAGTFGGTGTLTGDLTLSDGATIKVNDFSNPLTVSGALTASSGTITVDLPAGTPLGTDVKFLDVTGPITVGATFNVTIVGEPIAHRVIQADNGLKVVREFTVTFNLGEHGTRAGGGELVQTVAHGGAAVAPVVTVANGWEFTGWDVTFTDVTSDLTVTAQYSPLSVWSGVDTVDGITWQFVVSNGVAEVTSGTGEAAIPTSTSGAISVPSTLGGVPVTSIGNCAFYGCSGLTNVTIGDSVTSIGNDAFSGCSDLTSVTIPGSVTHIGDWAFFSCSSLTNVTIPDSVMRIGGGTFDGCNDSLYDTDTIIGVTLVDGWAIGNGGMLSGTLDLSGVRGIGDFAFQGCSGLTNVTIPDSVTSIGDYAFYKCSGLTSVTIPNSVTIIGNDAFSDCIDLTSVTIPRSVTIIGNDAFSDCLGLRIVIIPESVRNIGDSAFEHSGLTNIIFEGNAPTVGESAFEACGAECLMQVHRGSTGWGVDIPGTWNGMRIEYLDEEPVATTYWIRFVADDESYNSTYNYVYWRIDGGDYVGTLLGDSVEVPNHANIEIGDVMIDGGAVTWNGEYRLDQGTLTNVTCDITVTIITGNRLWIDDFVSDFHLNSAEVDTINGQLALSGTFTSLWNPGYEVSASDLIWMMGLGVQVWGAANATDEFVVLDYIDSYSLEGIGTNGWRATIAMPVGYSYFKADLQARSFAGCIRASEVASIVTSPQNLPILTIENGVLTAVKLNGATEVVIPDNVTSIGEGAFSECSGLMSVTIPSSVTNIGDWAFEYCEDLVHVTVPDSVVHVGDAAFVGCSGLADANGFVIVRNVLYGYFGDELNVVVPTGVTCISRDAFEDSDMLRSVYIPATVTRIGTGAFSWCSGLTSVTIPSNVESIGDWAFIGCDGLADGDGFIIVRDVLYGYVGEVSDVVIPDGVTRISSFGDYYDCERLKSMTIPASVTSICDWAFYNCAGMTNIVFEGDAPEIGEDAFEEVGADCVVQVRRGSTGWGVDIPGTWNGMRIEYIETDGPDLAVAECAIISSASFMPGDTVTVRYVEANVGTMNAVAPWYDRVMLKGEDGARVNLRTVRQSDEGNDGEGAAATQPGAIVTNFVDCAISDLVSLAGNVRFVVAADVNDDVEEMDEANNEVKSDVASLGRRLYLMSASTSVKENVSGGVRFTVKRSGPVNEALTVAVGNTDTTSATAPATVTIPAGSVSTIFTVAPIDNAIVDGTRVISVSVSADGFTGAFVPLTVLDDEVPRLTVTLDQASIREGDGVITATVTREGSTEGDLTVYLAGTSGSRASYPSSVVIPSGSASVTFEISVPNNDTAQVASELTLRASSSGYQSTAVTYTVEDDDVPGVVLTIAPEAVQEGGAVHATLERADLEDRAKAITVRLTASNPDDIASMPSSITIPAGKTTVGFYIYISDDGLDNVNHKIRYITIDGAVLIESCGCNGQPSSGDAISATLGIIDNDGPALSLRAEPATMKEGLDVAGYLILSHNSTLTEDLRVNVWADANGVDEVELPEYAIIPAGVTSVRIPVKTLDDGMEDGSQLVSVYAEVDGDTFAPASTWVQVSDQNLPDLTVAGIETASSVVALENLAVTFAVTNIGFMARSGAIPYAVHVVKGATASSISSSTFVKSGTLTGGIDVGGILVGTVSLSAPEMPGDYRVAIVIDPDGTILELDSANNTGWSSEFTVGAAYTATAQVIGESFLPGTEIEITGVATRANGSVAANVPVDVYVLVDGTRRTLSVTTDSDGSYAVIFSPTSGEAGNYTVGACYPGVASTVAQDSFSILGMKRSSSSNIIWDYALGDSASRTVTIQNRSSVPLTGFTVTFTDKPDECEIVHALADAIPANGSATLTLTATAIGVTEQTDYRKFHVHIEAAEGVSLDFPLYFHSQTQKAYLRPTPTRIDTTMAIGETRYIDVTIVNDGKGDSGAITATIPSVNWLKIVGGASINNLANGESATITLARSPTPDDGLEPMRPLSGAALNVACANGTGCSIPLKFTPVSENTGGVRIDAIDDGFYTLESSPHLSNATVRISNPYTGVTVATGITDENGLWETNGIPEGTYQLTITAPRHSTYAEALTINPSRTANVTAFLQFQAISVNWDVVRTEIEDEYDVTLVLEYETSVPVPVIKVTMPDKFPNPEIGQPVIFPITYENIGKVTAKDVQTKLPDMPEGIEVESPSGPVDIPAGGTATAIKIFKKTKQGDPQWRCRYWPETLYRYDCGPEGQPVKVPYEIIQTDCPVVSVNYSTWTSPSTPSEPSRTGSGSGWVGIGGAFVEGGPTIREIKTDCDPKKTRLRKAIENCKMAWQDAIDYVNEIIENENVGDSDCIGNQFPLTAEAKAPTSDERALGDLMRDAYNKSMEVGSSNYDEDLVSHPINLTSIGYERFADTDMIQSWVGMGFNVNGEGVITDGTGLKARLYKSHDNNKLVLAFAGSEFNRKDWLGANLPNLICMKTGQYENAARLLGCVLHNWPGTIKVVGHSLGGGLTQYAMLSNDLEGRVSGMTYNSAGICESSVPNLSSCETVAANIANYRAVNDPVSAYGNHVGPVYNMWNASGHSAVYIGSDHPPKSLYDDLWSIGTGLSAGMHFFVRTPLAKLSDLFTRSKYGTAALAEMGMCITDLWAVMEAGDSIPWPEIMADAEYGRLEDTFNKYADTQIKDAALRILLSQFGVSMELKRKAEYFGGAYWKAFINETFGIKEARSIPRGMLSAAASMTGNSLDEWMALTDEELDAFLSAAFEITDSWTFDKVRLIAPEKISDAAVEAFVLRIVATGEMLSGTSTEVETIDFSEIDRATKALNGIRTYARSRGYASAKDMWNDALAQLETYLDGSTDAVCASVTLKLSQTLAMTREAFDGTLTLYNGNTTTPITNLKLDLSILDEDGNECKDLFVTNNLGTTGAMSSGWIVDGGLSVSASGTGSAMIRFVPERGAAPTEEKLYRFGGTVTYTDPFSGETATVKLTPVSLTVSPSPYLHLDYFVQRDVFADDPFTPDVVEASMPAEVAVLVRNVGGGNANRVTIASAQPETVQNEKGLSVAFKLTEFPIQSSALNGAAAHLGLNTVSLGTIEPNESKVAQWWLTSTIEGHFIGMSATVTPVNSWNTPNTTLVDLDAPVHKLVRSIVADGDTLPDFLVCDGSDLYGTPNEIYTAHGDQLPVYVATVSASSALSAGSEIELPISLTPAQSGWNYGYAAIPGLFHYTISRIVRGDGTEIPLRNAWITDRTFRDGTTPLLEERLHVVDEFASNAAQTYTVYLTAKPTDVPEVVSFEGVTDGAIENAVRDSVTVTFSKSIDPLTLTVDDLTLTKHGVYFANLSSLTITAADGSGTRFIIGNLSALCGDYGRYELTVQCAGVADVDGNLGRYGKSIAWTYAANGSVAPQLVSLVRRMSDGFGGTEFVVTFDRNVSAATVAKENFTLRRNGGTMALPSAAEVRCVDDSAPYQFVLVGMDAAFAEDGEYELTFVATGVADEAGNVALGSKSVRWTMDNTPPAQITDLAISPDGGFSDTDGNTYTNVLTVTGTLPEGGLTAEIIAKYVSGGETVLATMPSAGGDSLPAGAFSQDINLPGSGNVTLVVRLTDAAGNSSDTEKNVFVDGIALTGTLTGASEDEGIVTTSATLTFSAAVTDGDVILDKFSLTRDGEAVALEGVTLTKVNDTTYTLTGLDALCAEDGQYVLRFDGAAVRKYTSGLPMSGGPLSMTWRYANPDREPPTVTAVLFDGEAPHGAYTNVFSTVAVTFSEAMNVPELIEKGLIGKAARIDLLDAAGVVTGCVVATRSASAPYQWDNESNTLSWTIDPLDVPAGRARLMIDAGLIADLAGNRLAVDANGQDAHSPSATGETPVVPVANGLRAYALSETVLAQVNAQAMPTWYNGELYVGEKTADDKGKIRHYAANGTWTYLQSEGVDIEIPAQGCQGASVAFADMDGDGVAETYVGTATGNVLKYPGGETIASLGANRAMPYACDIDGDGRDELIAGGMDGRIRLISYAMDSGTYSVTLVSDVNGAPITVPNGRAAPVVADINHDSIADIVSGDTAGNVWAYLGEGAAWCGQSVTVFTNNVSFADRSRLGYGDVDGDGIEDIIVGRSDGSVTVMLGAETPSPIVSFSVKAVVSASAGEHGAIAPAGDVTYDGGDTPEYVITPNMGYHVADVQIDGVYIGATNSYVFAPLTTSHAIHATFTATSYAITYTGLKGATNPNPLTYTVEDKVTFAALGDVYGWVFTGWTPASIALGSTGSVEVSANWERQKFNVTVNAVTQQYNYEDEVMFVTNAIINAGATQYVCKGWAATNADPSTGDSASAEFKVLGDVSFAWLWETNVVTLAQSVNAEGLEWGTGGITEWLPEWSEKAADGLHEARCGAIPNGTNAWLLTTVESPGTISFKWRSALASRNTKYQFMVDGEVKGMLTGTNGWTEVSISVFGDRAHEIRWRLMTGRSGTSAGDCVALDEVVWTPTVPPTLAEALNIDLVWTTDGDVTWRGVARESLTDSRDAWAVVSGLGDDGTAWVQTRVYGSGILLFDWAISCEEDYDWMELSVDGNVCDYISGDVGWTSSAVEIVGDGWHVVRWEYVKDEMDDPELAGENRAMLDNVVWSSDDVVPALSETQTTPVPVPYSELETSFRTYLDAAKGDYEAAAHTIGRNGYAIWESYVAGLEPDKEDSKFTAKIEMVDDKPVVTWEPDNPELRATRTYKTYGKKTLIDRDWTPVTDANKDQYNFFKVTVEMK